MDEITDCVRRASWMVAVKDEGHSLKSKYIVVDGKRGARDFV